MRTSIRTPMSRLYLPPPPWSVLVEGPTIWVGPKNIFLDFRAFWFLEKAALNKSRVSETALMCSTNKNVSLLKFKVLKVS